MKLSTKLLFTALAFGTVFFLAEQIAIKNAFTQKTRVDFAPETIAKPVEPFKNIVFESTLLVNSNLEIKSSEHFAVGASEDFWKTFELDQRGDTLFVRQISDRFAEEDGDEIEYAGLTVLAPDLHSIRTDAHVDLLAFRADSLVIEQSPISFDRGTSTIKNSTFRSLSFRCAGGHNLKFSDKNEIENLQMELLDSSSCDLKCPISGQIRLKNSPKSTISMLGENMARVQKMEK